MNSIQRTIHLVKREFLLHRKAIIVSLLIVYALIIFKSVFTRYLFTASYFYVNDFTSSIYLFTFIVSSIAFTEIWKNTSGVLYLMLPASRVEKFIAKIVSHILIPIVGFTLLYGISFFTADGINVLIFGSGHGMEVNFVDPVIYFNTLLISSVSFLGSTIFKRFAAAKTFGIFVFINAFTFLLFFTLSDGAVDLMINFQSALENSEINTMLQLEYDLVHKISQRSYFLFMLVPLSLGIAYYRFKEAEA